MEGGPFSLKKSLAEFASADAKKVKSIFGGGVYVAENTHRLANVRLCAEGAQIVRCSEPQPFSNGSPAQRVPFERVSKIIF